MIKIFFLPRERILRGIKWKNSEIERLGVDDYRLPTKTRFSRVFSIQLHSFKFETALRSRGLNF